MNHIAELGGEILVGVLLIAAGAGLASWRGRAQRSRVAEAAVVAATTQREQTFQQIEELFMGTPANRMTGMPAQPGLVTQIHELQTKQEKIEKIATEAGADATAIRSELTRNGGTSTKDAAYQAARSAEAAAAAAEIAAKAAERTERLLKRHMENGLEIMEVGKHNDLQIIAAIEAAGVVVEDYRPFPDVDAGEDL